MPYYVDTSRWTLAAAEAPAKQTFIAFFGSTDVHEHCGACAEGHSPRAVRVRLLSQLHARCSRDVGARRCEVSEPSGDRDDLAAGEADALVRHMRDAQFCPVPRGDAGGSKRFFCAIAALCVPVVVSDHLPRPFAERVPYGEFVLTVPERDVLSGHVDVYERLANVSAAQLARMQDAMRAVRHEVAFAPHGSSPTAPSSGRAVLNLLQELLTS